MFGFPVTRHKRPPQVFLPSHQKAVGMIHRFLFGRFLFGVLVVLALAVSQVPCVAQAPVHAHAPLSEALAPDSDPILDDAVADAEVWPVVIWQALSWSWRWVWWQRTEWRR